MKSFIAFFCEKAFVRQFTTEEKKPAQHLICLKTLVRFSLSRKQLFVKLNCASVYVIEPQKHKMLDFTLVPKLLGFFQWNDNRELVLLRVFFGGGEMVTGN